MQCISASVQKLKWKDKITSKHVTFHKRSYLILSHRIQSVHESIYAEDLFKATESFCNLDHKFMPARECFEKSVL
jgi:hypothetical protein